MVSIKEGNPEYKPTLIVLLRGYDDKGFEVRALLKASKNEVSTNGFGIGIILTYVQEVGEG